MGLSRGEERVKAVDNFIGEIMAEIFPNLEKETDIQFQKAQKFPKKMKPKRQPKLHYN